MSKYNYRLAKEIDLPFIINVYNDNIEALHGEVRSLDIWKQLLSKDNCDYFIVHSDTDLAWFRLDYSNNSIELGMLQVYKPYQRQGIGRYIISVTEDIAKSKGTKEIIIHTTEDNKVAQHLYGSCGYELIEVGPCTTADGKERIGHTYRKYI